MAAPAANRAALLAASAGAVGWTAMVALAPSPFFAWATGFGFLWSALSLAAGGERLRGLLRPRPLDAAVGLLAGALLFALSRGFLDLACGRLSLGCEELAGLFARFQPGALFPALALALVIAPAEELFWRGVVQQRLGARLGPKVAVLLTALASALLLAAARQWLLALAALGTSVVWGALVEWRRGLLAAIVSHAAWDLGIAVLSPPA